MRNKKIAGAGAAVAVGAVTAMLLGSSPAFADEETRFDSAYAFAASGLLDVDPLPFVESTDGELVTDELLGLGERTADAEADGIFVGLLNVAAEQGKSETSVARVELLDILRADLIRTHCEDADGDKSGLEIINGTLLGEELPETPVPGQEFDLSPLAKITFNDQTRNADGSLTVTGIELQVLPGRGDGENETFDAADRAALPDLGGLLGVELPTSGINTEQDLLDELSGPLGLDLAEALQTITVGVATCNELGDDDGKDDDADKDDDGNDDGSDDADSDAAPGAAPAPTVVEATLPVTG